MSDDADKSSLADKQTYLLVLLGRFICTLGFRQYMSSNGSLLFGTIRISKDSMLKLWFLFCGFRFLIRYNYPVGHAETANDFNFVLLHF